MIKHRSYKHLSVAESYSFLRLKSHRTDIFANSTTLSGSGFRGGRFNGGRGDMRRYGSPRGRMSPTYNSRRDYADSYYSNDQGNSYNGAPYGMSNYAPAAPYFRSDDFMHNDRRRSPVSRGPPMASSYSRSPQFRRR